MIRVPEMESTFICSLPTLSRLPTTEVPLGAEIPVALATWQWWRLGKSFREGGAGQGGLARERGGEQQQCEKRCE